MLIRLARSSDLPALMALLRRVVPQMRAAGNLQWGDDYPNERVFARDIERAELWIAQIVEPDESVRPAGTDEPDESVGPAGTDEPDESVAGPDEPDESVGPAETDEPDESVGFAEPDKPAESNEPDIAGVAAINTDQSHEYAQIGWDIHEPAIVVHRLAVDPAYRGAGVASALMRQAETIARARKISRLRVDTSMENTATPPLFAKLGYSFAGEISLHFRPGLRVLCYEKRLDLTPLQVAAIALGSNLASRWGDREANLREAVRRVAGLGEVRAVSAFYDTAPVGYTEQPRFLNAAMLLTTELEPLELMRALLDIELAMGRNRADAPAKGPRIIDLDLLLMGDVVLAGARSQDGQTELTLPHPAMSERRFVLEPLAEIAPDLRVPLCVFTVAEMLAQFTSQRDQ